MKFVEIKVTRALDGFHWAAFHSLTGKPVMREGKPLKSREPFGDGWEARVAGDNAIASYDREASYIVEELVQSEYAAERAKMKKAQLKAKAKDNAARKAA